MSPSFLCRPLYLGHRALLTHRRVVATSPGGGGAANSLFAQQGRYPCCCDQKVDKVAFMKCTLSPKYVWCNRAATETGPVRPRGVRAALRARAAGQGLRARPQHVEQPLDRQLYPRLRDRTYDVHKIVFYILRYSANFQIQAILFLVSTFYLLRTSY